MFSVVFAQGKGFSTSPPKEVLVNEFGIDQVNFGPFTISGCSAMAFNAKDILPKFLDLSEALPNLIDVRWLPPVPNFVSWIKFIWHLLFSRFWDAGNQELQIWVGPPPLLPRLSKHMDAAEAWHRFTYWTSFLLCGPPLMGHLIEMFWGEEAVLKTFVLLNSFVMFCEQF